MGSRAPNGRLPNRSLRARPGPGFPTCSMAQPCATTRRTMDRCCACCLNQATISRPVSRATICHPSNGSCPSGRRWTAGFPRAGRWPTASRTSARHCRMATGSIPSSSRSRTRGICSRVACARSTRPWSRRHDVPGAALAERLYRHCTKEDGFLPSGRLPLAETIFRCVVAADHGGLTDGALVEMLRERTGAVPVSTTLLRRLRDSVRPYPIRRVDADLFGGRR